MDFVFAEEWIETVRDDGYSDDNGERVEVVE